MMNKVPDIFPDIFETFEPTNDAVGRSALVDDLVRDILGVQPMTGPVGQIFTLKVRYDNDGKNEDDKD